MTKPPKSQEPGAAKVDALLGERPSSPAQGLLKPLARAVPPLVAITVMGTVLLFIRHEFSSLVEPRLLHPWLTYMAGCLAFLTGTFIVSMVPRWRARKSREFWVRMGQVSSTLFCIGIAISVWILMPPASDVLRFLMVLLCMWFIAMVIILNADRVSVAGAIGVVGSMTAFTLTYDLPYALPLAGFLIMEGVALVLIRRQVWRAARTLETALKLASSERDAKTRFIASASHDLQQPLLAASLYFDHAISIEAGPARDQAVAGARQAFNSTRALLQGMLEHLRLEAGAETARIKEFDLGLVVRDAVMEQAGNCQAAAIELIFVPFSLPIRSDPNLVSRIMSNLICNAIQHARAKRILVGSTRRGDAVSLWVVDDGCGIAAADTERIFEDYAQAGLSEGNRGGFGLGLASSRRMAALIAGSLELDQRWKNGSAFRLNLSKNRFAN